MNSQPEYVPTEGLTLEEDKQMVDLLKKFNTGRISTPLYTEFARILPQAIIEVVIFRKNNNLIETLLVPRPKDDISWPNMLHTPGTAVRLSDYHRKDGIPKNGIFERLQKSELNNNFAFTPIPVRLDNDDGVLYRQTKRGPETATIYFTELPENSDKDFYVWHPVDELAQNPKFIQHQLAHVLLAAKQYQQFKDNQQI